MLEKYIEELKQNDDQIDKFITIVNNRFSIYSNNDHMNPQEALEIIEKSLNISDKKI